MALVSVTNVEVMANPAPVTQNFQFEITFECIANLADGKHAMASIAANNDPINLDLFPALFSVISKISTSILLSIRFLIPTNTTLDIEWKLIYVGSAESEAHDQELDSILVGPIPVGLNKFVFEAPHPDFSKLPETEITGVTVVLITCS